LYNPLIINTPSGPIQRVRLVTRNCRYTDSITLSIYVSIAVSTYSVSKDIPASQYPDPG
jgi:hypothetical protein